MLQNFTKKITSGVDPGLTLGCYKILQKNYIRGGSRINFRVLQNFTKKIEHRNDIICRKIIDSARSKEAQS